MGSSEDNLQRQLDRGSPKPRPGAEAPFLVCVNSPKLPLENFVPGFAQFVSLKIFRISARSSVSIFSVMCVCLKIEKSTAPNPGP